MIVSFVILYGVFNGFVLLKSTFECTPIFIIAGKLASRKVREGAAFVAYTVAVSDSESTSYYSTTTLRTKYIDGELVELYTGDTMTSPYSGYVPIDPQLQQNAAPSPSPSANPSRGKTRTGSTSKRSRASKAKATASPRPPVRDASMDASGSAHGSQWHQGESRSRGGARGQRKRRESNR